VNERRNPTLYAMIVFFSSSFHVFSPGGDDSVAQRLWDRLGINRGYTQWGTGAMTRMKVSIARYISDDPQPGIVECQFQDAYGHQCSFIEKTLVERGRSRKDPAPSPHER
jgi:hypothetical protein